MGLFKFLFGQDHRSRAQRDQYRPSVMWKNLISPINDYGTCFGYEGTGHRTLDCRALHAGWLSQARKGGRCDGVDGEPDEKGGSPSSRPRSDESNRGFYDTPHLYRVGRVPFGLPETKLANALRNAARFYRFIAQSSGSR